MLEKSCGWWLIWYFLFFCHGGAEATESRPYIDPNITQSSKVMSPKGQPLVINCGIDEFPKPLITWYRYKSLEVMAPDNRVSVLSNGSLHFMQLTTGDQGYYYCDGKNDLGQVRLAEIFVEVAYINPHFKQEPDSQYIRGKSRTLPCSPPASHPPANVTWYKDNQPMKYRTGEHAAYILDPAKSIWDLFFPDIQKQDEGSYFCNVSNNFAVPMSRTSKSAVVQIEGQLQWVVKEKVTDYGQNLTLFCPVENCCSKRQAGWFVEGKSKILDVKTFSNDPKVKYHGTYNKDGFGVVIRNLSEADLNVTYHCDYGFNQSIPTYLLHGNVFKESVPDKDKDEENDTVTILSIVGSIVASIVVVAIIIVCIRKMKRQICEDPPPNPDEVPLMEDVVSAPGQPRNIKVNVLSPKRIEVSWLPPTDSANISYNIYFNDSSVMKHPDNNYILEGLIPDTVYHIRVSAITNGRERKKSPMIEVKTSPLGSPTVEVHQSSYSVTTGKKVTLVSTVSSSPGINDVYWERNIDGSITFMNFDTKTRKYSGSTTTTPSLTIYNASFSDAGTYTCWAINDVGTGRSTITTLSVTESLPTVEVQQSSYSVTTGKKVTLGCTVSSRLDINNVEWERNIGGSITLITSNTNIDKYNGSDTTTPSLTILNASPSDAGTYTCCASSDVGTGLSTTTTLSVTETPGQPRNVEVNVLSLNRIKVSWLPPTDSASITSYNIYFNGSLVMEDQDNNHVLEGLNPDTVYQIQVSAITNDREGEKSPMIEVKTSPFDVYRVCVNFTDILYTKQLDDGNSNEFKSLAENLQKELTELFVSVPGKQVVVIVQFKYIEDSLLTIFDLMSWGCDKESVLRETIEKPLRDGRIGSYQASLEGFTFSSFSVVYRVDVTFTDGNSNEFKSLAGNIQTDLTKLFLKVPGKQVVIVQFIEDSLLTFDLTSWEYYGESVLRETIEKPLKDGIIGRYKASLEGFNFRAFRGDFHGAIVEKYRTKPKILKDLLDDKMFLSKLLEECGKNTEGLYPRSSGGIGVENFPAALLVAVMKYRQETKIVEEVLKDMSTTLTSQSSSTVVILYHRSVKTAMEKVCKDLKKTIDKKDCEKPIDKEDGEKPIDKEDCEKQIEIFRKFIEKHKFDYSASSCLQQCIDKSRQ